MMDTASPSRLRRSEQPSMMINRLTNVRCWWKGDIREVCRSPSPTHDQNRHQNNYAEAEGHLRPVERRVFGAIDCGSVDADVALGETQREHADEEH